MSGIQATSLKRFQTQTVPLSVYQQLEGESEMLRERVRQLEQLLIGSDAGSFMLLGCTAMQAAVGSALMSGRRMSMQALHEACSFLDRRATYIQIVHRHIWKLRKVLTPLGVEITTLHGYGFCLLPPAKARLREIFDSLEEHSK